MIFASKHRSFDNLIFNLLDANASYCYFLKKPCIHVTRTIDTQLDLFRSRRTHVLLLQVNNTRRIYKTTNLKYIKTADNISWSRYCPSTMSCQRGISSITSETYILYLSNLHHEILACAPEYLRICYAQHILVFRVALKLVTA